MNTGYTLHDLMKVQVLTADALSTIQTLAVRMKTQKVGSLIITRNNMPVGIVTEKDIVRKIVAQGKSTHDQVAQEIMSSPILSMDVGADLYDAYVFLNKKQIRHLPVSERGKIVGVVTMSDLIRVEPSILETNYQKALDIASSVQ